MKKSYKIVSYIIVILIVVSLGYKYYRWLNPTTKTITVTQSSDTTFHSTTHDTYRPPSLPSFIEHHNAPPSNIPSNMRPKDVREIITVVKVPGDTTHIIIGKDGSVNVPKQNGEVLGVTVTDYLPPILDFDWYVKLGIDGNADKISPMIGIGFCEIYGRVELPIFTLDLNGIGVGVDVKIIEPISIGVLFHDSWTTQKSIRLMVSYGL